MQINNTNSFNASSIIASTANVNATNVQQVSDSTQVDRLREQARVAQEQSSTNPQKQQSGQQSRFDVDQQALAIVEQQQQQKSSKQTFSANNQNTTYDQPSNQNQTAVAAYQAVDNISQRENIQQSFGIDLIA